MVKDVTLFPGCSTAPHSACVDRPRSDARQHFTFRLVTTYQTAVRAERPASRHPSKACPFKNGGSIHEIMTKVVSDRHVIANHVTRFMEKRRNIGISGIKRGRR